MSQGCWGHSGQVTWLITESVGQRALRNLCWPVGRTHQGLYADIPRVRSTGPMVRVSQASTNCICCKSQSHHRPFLKLVNDYVDYSYLRKLLKFGVRQSTEELPHVHGAGELVCGWMKHCFADWGAVNSIQYGLTESACPPFLGKSLRSGRTSPYRSLLFRWWGGKWDEVSCHQEAGQKRLSLQVYFESLKKEQLPLTSGSSVNLAKGS